MQRDDCPKHGSAALDRKVASELAEYADARVLATGSYTAAFWRLFDTGYARLRRAGASKRRAQDEACDKAHEQLAVQDLVFTNEEADQLIARVLT